MKDDKALQEENERLKNYVEILENQVKASELTISNMTNSLSWKLTRPVRFLKAHCAPVGAVVDFCKDAKKQGLKTAVRESRLKRYYKKHRYCDRLLPSEYKRQVEEMKDCKVTYGILCYLRQTDDSSVEKMFSQIAVQSYLPERLLLYGEAASPEMEAAQKTGLPVVCTEQGDIKALCHNLEGLDRVICVDGAASFSQELVYQLQKNQNETMGDIVYCDHGIFLPEGDCEYYYKPDYAPHYLETENYIGNVICVEGSLLRDMFKNHTIDFDKNNAFIYEILLKHPEQVSHIPELLYGRSPVLAEERAREEKCRIDYWKQKGSAYEVTPGLYEGSSHISFPLVENPLVSILIPTCDHIEDLQTCINSVMEKSTYSNYEIVIIENNSKEEKTFDYYKQLEQLDRIRIVTWEHEFNYSAINNYGLQYIKGEYVILLNNDIEVISPNWMEEMLYYATRDEVGAVGAKLYFPDDTIQHAGVILGIRRLAGHGHRNFDRDADGYMHRLKTVQDYSIVTAACLMIKKDKIEACHGFDTNLVVDYNDVDLCMKLRKMGYYNVFTPYAQLYHYESKSRGENKTPQQLERNGREFFYFTTKWYHEIMKGDPFYNKHLTLDEDDFSIK